MEKDSLMIKALSVKLTNIQKIESNLLGLLNGGTISKYLPRSYFTDRVNEIKSLAKKTPRAELEWLWGEWKDSKELSALGKKTLKEAINVGL